MDDAALERHAVETVDRGLNNLPVPEAAEVYTHLARNAKEAAITLGVLLYSTNENVKLSAARDILDRSGYKPVERKDITSGGQVISAPAMSDEQLIGIIDGYLKRTSIGTSSRVVGDEPAGEADSPEGNI